MKGWFGDRNNPACGIKGKGSSAQELSERPGKKGRRSREERGTVQCIKGKYQGINILVKGGLALKGSRKGGIESMRLPGFGASAARCKL